jgi:hypothetical protein
MSDKNLRVSIGAEISGLVKGLNDSKTATKGAAREFDMMGAGLRSLAGAAAGLVTVSSIFRGIASSVEAANVQLQAVAAVESRLRSMGDAAGFTSQELQKMASGLQAVSLFGDEEILTSVTQQMLTFGNVSGDVFRRAQQSALDLSTVLGTGLQNSAIMLGKALNDPVQGLTALRRVGVQFSNAQEAAIKSMVATNRVAEAQGVILREVEKQFGGAAQAAANAGTGPITQLKNAFGDLQEELGIQLLPSLNRLATLLKDKITSKEAVDSLRDFAFALNMVIDGAITALGPLQRVYGWLDAIGGFTPPGALLNWFKDYNRELRITQETTQAISDAGRAVERMMLTGFDAPAPAVTSSGGGGNARADVRKTLAQALTEQLREQQQIQRDILRMGVDEYRTTLRRLSAITAVNQALAQGPTAVAAQDLMSIGRTLEDMPMPTIFLPEGLANVRLLNEEFNRMNFVLAQMSGETAVALGEGLRGAFESSLNLIADSVVGLQKMTNIMDGLRDILRRFIADLAVAIARAYVLASLQSIISPKSTFGAIFAGALGIGGGVAPKMKVDMGTMTIRGSDIVASMNAELRLQSQAGA